MKNAYDLTANNGQEIRLERYWQIVANKSSGDATSGLLRHLTPKKSHDACQ
jgi:hypothetical protein